MEWALVGFFVHNGEDVYFYLCPKAAMEFKA